jgi:hypothetical protein
MRKIQYILVVILLTSTTVMGQNFVEALRLSNYQVHGTAHSMAMGNAIGAIGGDFTSLSINPAGIAVYRTNEFTFTPSFNLHSSDLVINGNKYSDNNFKLNLSQIGYVNSSPINSKSSSLVSFNFGVGFNRLADFNQIAMGSNNQSSISFLDGIVDYASSESLSNNYLGQSFGQVEYRDWDAKLAWDTYLVDPAVDNSGNEIDGEYVSILFEDETVNQNKSWVTSGAISEYVISGGLNFNHKFYLGATFGIQDIYYNKTSVYTEAFSDDSFTYTDDYELMGTGYVFKLGAIYKPISAVRLGLAFHTPTFYVLEESSTLSMESRLQENYYAEGTNLFSYDFYTPMKAILSGAFVVSKFAILSFDAEYVDYSTMRYRDGDNNDPMTDINTDIDNAYEEVFNYRAGAEIRLTKSLSMQAGYELFEDPFKSNLSFNGGSLKSELNAISCGLGYSDKNFFVDAAFKQYSGKTMINDVQPNYSNLPIDYTTQKFIMTLGFRF